MTIYTLPDLKLVNAIGLPGWEIPLNLQWISNERLIVENGLEMGLRERPRATGEVVAVNLDGSKQAYLYGYKNFKQSRRGAQYGDDRGDGVLAHLPDARDEHIGSTAPIVRSRSRPTTARSTHLTASTAGRWPWCARTWQRASAV